MVFDNQCGAAVDQLCYVLGRPRVDISNSFKMVCTFERTIQLALVRDIRVLENIHIRVQYRAVYRAMYCRMLA